MLKLLLSVCCGRRTACRAGDAAPLCRVWSATFLIKRCVFKQQRLCSLIVIAIVTAVLTPAVTTTYSLESPPYGEALAGVHWKVFPRNIPSENVHVILSIHSSAKSQRLHLCYSSNHNHDRRCLFNIGLPVSATESSLTPPEVRSSVALV
jgi:hypothetical protein